MAATNELPVNASLQQLRNQAKDLLRSQRGGLPDAFHRLRKALPDHPARSDAQISEQGFSLRDAQRAIAREYGFESWAELELKNQVMTSQARAEDFAEMYRRRILAAYPDLDKSKHWRPRSGEELETEHFLQRIRDAFPELQWTQHRRMPQGSDVVAIVLDESIVFRFIEGNEAEDIVALLREIEILKRMRDLTSVPIPEYCPAGCAGLCRVLAGPRQSAHDGAIPRAVRFPAVGSCSRAG